MQDNNNTPLTDDEKYLKQGDVHFLNEEYIQAMECYEKSANLNNPNAMQNMAQMYLDGLGVSKDHQKVDELLSKAKNIKKERYITQGDVHFANEEYAQALECYKESAVLKNSNAMYYLGHMYECGLGVAKDFNQAKDWYFRSANLDNSHAMFRIGCGYFFWGNKNYPLAMEWFQLSAHLNHSEAMYAIGLMYGSGTGVIQDSIKAETWYEKSKQADEQTNYNR